MDTTLRQTEGKTCLHISICACHPQLIESVKTGLGSCERSEGVAGVLTLNVGGVAQTCHDDRVVELKEQLVVEEVDGEGQEGKVKEERRSRIKENAPWI